MISEQCLGSAWVCPGTHLLTVWGGVCEAHAVLAAILRLLYAPGDLVKAAVACAGARTLLATWKYAACQRLLLVSNTLLA